jgi:BON domain-containing protein
MYHKPKVPDRQILQKVTTQLPARGIRPPCNVRVNVRNGTVTISGTIEFEMQRKAAVHAATGVNGVQRVVDQLTVIRNTIGGWHTKSAGMDLKQARTQARPEASTDSATETVQSSDKTAATAEESATTDTASSAEPAVEDATTPSVPIKPR